MYILSYKRYKGDDYPIILVRYSLAELLPTLQESQFYDSYVIYSVKVDGSRIELTKIEERNNING